MMARNRIPRVSDSRDHSMARFHAGIVTIIATCTLAALSADNSWPQFRGAHGGVAADDPSLPDTWDTTKNVAWKVDVPGRSWSSPVVWGDHIFVTTAINTVEAETLLPVSAYVSRSNGGSMSFRDVTTPTAPHRWMLYDFDFKTGKIRWEREV